MKIHSPITTWALEERPREKLLHKGCDALTNAELLAILIGAGTVEDSALDLARKLLLRYGSLKSLARASVSELTQLKGIGPARAIRLVSAFEIARRKDQNALERVKINSIIQAAGYLKKKLQDENQEVFYVLFLNAQKEIIAEKALFKGSVNHTIIDPKLIFKAAVNHLASGIIIAHNHPSGGLEPSEADIRITEKLARGSIYFDIHLVDHLIVSHRGYYSFADEGRLP